MLRRLELLSGVATGAVGVLGVAYATAWLLRTSGAGGVRAGATFLLLTLVCLLGALVGAVLHAHRGRLTGFVLLSWCTYGLSFFVLIGLLDIGLFLFPTALLAWVTHAVGLGASLVGDRGGTAA